MNPDAKKILGALQKTEGNDVRGRWRSREREREREEKREKETERRDEREEY